MKNLVVPVVLVVLLASFIALRATRDHAATPPPVFAPLSLTAAMDRALREDRLLLVKVSAEWCPPCQAMNREAFVDRQVVEWLGAQAIAIEIDADRQGQTAQDLAVDALPTLIAFRGGKELARTVGYLNPAELLAWLRAVPPLRLPASPDASATSTAEPTLAPSIPPTGG